MLNTFLADPGKEVSRIAARAAIRQHLTSEIASRQCDVRTHEEAVGSPYTLVLTKTFGSYERETKRFAANQRLLAELPADDFATDGV
jgi:hypothetical protein